MPNDAQKTPIARTLNQFAEKKVRGYIELTGKALPAQVTAISGSIVTVKFLIASTPNSPYTLPPVTVPLAGPQWQRAPTQLNDQGVVIPADTYLGGISGLGGGSADLSLQANLSSLVFLPVGNKGWTPPINPNAYELYGPEGVILHDEPQTVRLTLGSASVSIVGSGAALSLILSTFQSFFNAHVHQDDGAGPPTIPMPNSMLTTVLMAE
jgi:hypothetical protein